MGGLDELIGALTALPAEERAQVERDCLASTKQQLWVPNVGPQTAAYFCDADELLYGGEAGGGKSDLLLGLALNEHQNSLILRRINQDVGELGDRLVEILGSNEGYKGHPPGWRGEIGGVKRRINLRGCEFDKDKQRHKGKPKDFYGFDELADFLESQFVFITTWNRSTDPNQRCRVVGATNGPTTADGQWIVRRWAPWLDPKHPNPAKSGEIRYFIAGADGHEIEVDGYGPHVVAGRPKPVRAKSRCFIRSRLEDNPDLARTDYGSRLDGLPEELRRVYRDGDFTVGMRDGDYQVIPTAWLDAAVQRWEDAHAKQPGPPKRATMSAMAVDVAPGGGDQRVIAYRYGGWFGPLDAKREVDKTGRKTAGDVVYHRRHNCPVIVDLGGGWGGDATIAMKDNGIDVVAFNGVVKSTAKTRDGKLGFLNKRAEATWRLREELDPTQEGGSAVMLPPDPELKSDLASFQWTLTSQGIQMIDKKEQVKALGRSPDKGDTVIMCLSEGNRAMARALYRQQQGDRPAQANVANADRKRGR